MNENVRKIFDMLGVEPNEKFRVGGLVCGHIFTIDENLTISDDSGAIHMYLLTSLLIGDCKIIKLPKEPKKKKIGDLTIREAKEMQDKICKSNVICKDCPFYDCCINDCVDLDKEIEIEVEE